ncbi:MAG: hypothetical protein LQ344_004177 [Seirophora lacunosa]|nr:MAG: hypothetical protein LQ344_004177 [Seirophora lacunosa]
MTNRAFTELYPADNETAQYIKALIGLGAVIVGKSKMASFAAGENPGDWIDFHCPVNPRGDQYQSPGSSTAGAAASLAGYSWLDYSIGTDKFFPTANEDQQSLLDDYVCVLENYLKTTRTQFSLVERWADCPPEAAEGKSLKDYLGNSICQHYYYDAYHEYDGFWQDYRREYEKEPYVGPLVRFGWDKGASLTMEERDQGKARLAVFRQWFHETVMRQDLDSLSDAILVLPEGKLPFNILEILGENTLAMVLELPHLVLPVGQNSYQSRASGRTEYRPVSASLVGAKGSDLMLLTLAREAFLNAGWRTEVEIGRYTYPVPPDGLRNRTFRQSALR